MRHPLYRLRQMILINNKKKCSFFSQQIPIQQSIVGPPPTTKPPTPPQLSRGTVQMKAGNTGTLGKGSRGEYRTPPVVIPPQVPSHYAPNYPIGHPRRQTSERPGYSAVPMPPSQQIAPVNLVHPLPPPPPNEYERQMPGNWKYYEIKGIQNHLKWKKNTIILYSSAVTIDHDT